MKLLLPITATICFIISLIVLFKNVKENKLRLLFCFLLTTPLVISIIDTIVINHYCIDFNFTNKQLIVYIITLITNCLITLGKGILIIRYSKNENIDYPITTLRMTSLDPLSLIMLIGIILVFKG